MESLNILNNATIKLLKNNNLLLPLIKSQLIKDTVDKIELSDNEKDQLKAAIIAKNKFSSEDEYKNWIKKQGLSESDVLNTISGQIKLNKHCKLEYGHIVERKFLERKDDLEEITYSLIRVEDKLLATELYLRIKEDETSFGKIAGEFSLGPEKDSNGIVGPLSLTKSHPILTEVLKSSKIGAINQPFIINGMWLIVRLESLKKSTLNNEMETKMSQELFNDWLNEESKKEFEILIKKLEQAESI